jgi:predicted amidohydrolase YtcJ
MLIRGAEVWSHGIADVRIAADRITAIGALPPLPGEVVLEANGAALLPGLHDHHIHLASSAVRASSVMCGPPEVANEAELIARLSRPGSGWLRGIGYHESIMGLPDAAALDTIAPARPMRIQHRSGRMWLLNSCALAELLDRASPPPGLERSGGRFTGRLFDEDAWLTRALGSAPPGFANISAQLARYGITGLTDMTPRNDAVMAAHFTREAAAGALRQRAVLAGTLALADAPPSPAWQLGPAKLHLHENAMPDFDETVRFIAAAHAQGRAVASHCTTETELVFTLAAIEAARSAPGNAPSDRIEHAGIATDGLIAEIARLRLAVVSQPHFIAERGDQYHVDVPPQDHAALYRLRAFLDAGVVLAAGSDSPFGSADPWSTMAAAVSRRTGSGAVLGAAEALTAEQAIALFLADPHDLNRQRRVAVGELADLCLLDRGWNEARDALSSDLVRATLIAGKIVHQRVGQPPIQRLPG